MRNILSIPQWFVFMCAMRMAEGFIPMPSSFIVKTGCSSFHSRLLAACDPDHYEIKVYDEHPRLIETAMVHCETLESFLENHVIANHTLKAFSLAADFVDMFYSSSNGLSTKKYVIIDSGCGVGMSSINLAKSNPGLPVIGVDRSFIRLRKNKYATIIDDIVDDKENEVDNPYIEYIEPQIQTVDDIPNILLVRADLVDFWVLAAFHSDWTVEKHYVLYPNPYPKAKHLRRRWHGHSIFPVILALGGVLTLRSNWIIYCSEMCTAIKAVLTKQLYCALSTVESNDLSVREIYVRTPLTNFERKYVNANLRLYELKINLGLRDTDERIKMLQYSPIKRFHKPLS